MFFQLKKIHYNQPQAGARERESRVRRFAEGTDSEGDVINKYVQLLFFILFLSFIECTCFSIDISA